MWKRHGIQGYFRAPWNCTSQRGQDRRFETRQITTPEMPRTTRKKTGEKEAEITVGRIIESKWLADPHRRPALRLLPFSLDIPARPYSNPRRGIHLPHIPMKNQSNLAWVSSNRSNRTTRSTSTS